VHPVSDHLREHQYHRSGGDIIEEIRLKILA
jgi:hypothetical protein